MRRAVVVLVLVLAGMSFGLVSPSLQGHLTQVQAGQTLPVHIVLKEQFDQAQARLAMNQQMSAQ